MNQFIAIMKESLWSTLATKLLYFEILGVLLVLIGVFPFSYEEQVRYKVVREEVRQPVETIKVWVAAAERPIESVAKTIWEALPENNQTRLKELNSRAAENVPRNRNPNQRNREERQAVMEALNYLITETRLWDDPAWADRIDNRQTKRLWDQRSSLSDEYLKRLNRMLIQEGLRGQLSVPPESNAMLTYAGMELYALPISGIGLSELIRLWLPFILDKVFLTIGVLLAILVTSTAIPQMLEEGSLYLLLSKPQSRLFLLLSKYVGSGILILIISTIFLSGVWLILGTRFNVWMQEILWCIPLALAIFLIYYSVTIAVGLMFRNVILSIIATILFAGTCYLLSFSRYSYSSLVALQRTADLQIAGDTIIRRSTHNHAQFYDAANGRWELGLYALANDMPPEVFATMSAIIPSTISTTPTYLADKKLYVGELQRFPPRPDMQKRLAIARRGHPEELSNPHVLGDLPFGCLGFWTDAQDRLHAVTSFGMVVRLNDVGQQLLSDAAQGKFPMRSGTAEETTDGKSDQAATVESNASSSPEPEDANQQAAPSPAAADDSTDESSAQKQVPQGLAWLPAGNIALDTARSLDRIAFDADRETCYSLGRTTISRAKRNPDGNYELETTLVLPWEWTALNRVPMGLLKGMLLIPLRGRSMVVFDAETLEPVAELQLPRSGIPLSITCNEATGLAVVTYANGETWLFDAGDKSMTKRHFVRGLVTTTFFDGDGRLVIAHGVDDLTIVDMPEGNVVETPTVEKNLIRNIYDWCVEPIYSVFPKPNECYVLIQHLANDGSVDSRRAEEIPSNAELDVDSLDAHSDNPWSPIITSGIFAVVLMLFNCFYFWRQEF
ncbi:MAG: ABC transporter permease [Pirellulaceae bacterium]|nr:ABC transporter permease [Pirellulaceae bacterium]